MSKDTGGPAFPESCGDQIIPGMTLRDYFAAHAPEEIPYWFEPKNIGTEPEIIRNEWNDWRMRRSEARKFQWPWYYADAMLAERSKE